MRVYIGSDHAGFELKTHLIGWLTDTGHEPVDCGPPTYVEDDDYPPYIIATALRVAADRLELGPELGEGHLCSAMGTRMPRWTATAEACS